MAGYRRSALPDEFEKRLEHTGLNKRLAKILEPVGMHIRAIFFDVDEGKENKRDGPDDAYTLAIYLLHATCPDPAESEAAANKVRREIESAFKAKLNADGKGCLALLREQPGSDPGSGPSHSASRQDRRFPGSGRKT